MPLPQQRFDDPTLKRMAKTVKTVLGEGEDNTVTPFGSREVPTYIKIVSNEFDEAVGSGGTNVYTVNSYASPLAPDALGTGVFAINLADIGKTEADSSALAADTWAIVIDQFSIGDVWYLIFNSGGASSAGGFWIKITATDEVDAGQEWDYTVSILDDFHEVVSTGHPAKNNWEQLLKAGYQNTSVESLYEIPINAKLLARWGQFEDIPTIYFSERNEPNCEPVE
ncbi:MAG TPA: hypothetical protein PK402_04260 [Tepidisphaeraceae bacterium]|nr:hypothetical protein [Tepidisphaeraceae bacterium]